MKNPTPNPNPLTGGILPICKAEGTPSFHLVTLLRRRTGIETIGHAGTLDPFARGVMLLLIGRAYTRLADQFLNSDKEYEATLLLGTETDSYDRDGAITATSPYRPTLPEITTALAHFQGEILQIPPMFSAKKQQGRKLYELARRGITVDRPPVRIRLTTTLLSYTYPHLILRIACSKGTYIRSIAHDLGRILQSGAHLISLTRTRSGTFTLDQCLPEADIPTANLTPYLNTSIG